MDAEPGTTKPTIRLEHLVHNGQRCIAMAFPYDQVLIAAAKVAGGRWSGSHKRWYTPNAPAHLRAIFQAFKGVAWVDSTPLFDKAPPATLPAKAPAQKSAPQKAPPPLNAVQQAALAAMQRKLEIARY